MASLLIIGGSGFFGKSILDAFQRGVLNRWNIDNVIAVARSAERLRLEAPHLISPRVELHSVDIATADTLPPADFVIHAAASTDVSRYHSQPLAERQNILGGTLNYCRMAKKFHVGSKIVYVSSGAVYGSQPPDLDRITEDYAAGSLDELPAGKRDYASAKRDAEEAVRQLGQCGLSVSIARCFAFVGSWLPLDQHFAIGNFIGDGLRGRPILVKAQNCVYRSYMYVDDLVEWLMTIGAHAQPQSPIYNVGSDEAVLMGELAGLVSCEFGVPAHVPPVTDAKADRYVPSIEKAKQELGVILRYDLRSAIRATINAIRQRS